MSVFECVCERIYDRLLLQFSEDDVCLIPANSCLNFTNMLICVCVCVFVRVHVCAILCVYVQYKVCVCAIQGRRQAKLI